VTLKANILCPHFQHEEASCIYITFTSRGHSQKFVVAAKDRRFSSGSMSSSVFKKKFKEINSAKGSMAKRGPAIGVEKLRRKRWRGSA